MSTVNSNSIVPQPLRREASLYWLHCNKCFQIYVRKQQRIFLFACHHIVCEHCSPPRPGGTVDETPTFKCAICQKIVRGRLLGNTMPSQIKEFLHPQPWLDDLPNMRITRFQQEQRPHFLEGMARTCRVVMKASKDNAQLRNEAKSAFEESKRAATERARLERRVREIIEQRKRIKRQRARLEAMQRSANKRTSFMTTSNANESGIGTGSYTINHLNNPRPRYPITSTNAPVGSTYMPFLHPFMGQHQRMPTPSTSVNSTKIKSFVHSNHNSFQL